MIVDHKIDIFLMQETNLPGFIDGEDRGKSIKYLLFGSEKRENRSGVGIALNATPWKAFRNGGGQHMIKKASCAKAGRVMAYRSNLTKIISSLLSLLNYHTANTPTKITTNASRSWNTGSTNYLETPSQSPELTRIPK